MKLLREHPTLALISGLGPALAALLTLLVDHGVLDKAQSAYILTAVVAVASLVTILRTTPVSVSALIGVVTTLLTGLVAFNVVIKPDVIGLVAAAITFIAGSFWHAKVSPSRPAG